MTQDIPSRPRFCCNCLPTWMERERKRETEIKEGIVYCPWHLPLDLFFLSSSLHLTKRAMKETLRGRNKAGQNPKTFVRKLFLIKAAFHGMRRKQAPKDIQGIC